MKNHMSGPERAKIPGEAPAGWPDADSIAALRDWYAGLSTREAIDRYLPNTVGEGRSARGALGRIWRQVAAFARSRHHDEWETLLAHPDSERRTRSKAVLRVLELLPGLPSPEPSITDDVGRWFSERTTRLLGEQGIRTLSDLTVHIPRRGQWWRAIPGLGQMSARHVEAFFAAHPALTERARALIATIE